MIWGICSNPLLWGADLCITKCLAALLTLLTHAKTPLLIVTNKMSKPNIPHLRNTDLEENTRRLLSRKHLSVSNHLLILENSIIPRHFMYFFRIHQIYSYSHSFSRHLLNICCFLGTIEESMMNKI